MVAACNQKLPPGGSCSSDSTNVSSWLARIYDESKCPISVAHSVKSRPRKNGTISARCSWNT